MDMLDYIEYSEMLEKNWYLGELFFLPEQYNCDTIDYELSELGELL